jgi:hypothetical protein
MCTGIDVGDAKNGIARAAVPKATLATVAWGTTPGTAKSVGSTPAGFVPTRKRRKKEREEKRRE